MTLPDEWKKRPVILVAEGGLQDTLPRSSDSIADWIDLMEAVEALCPKWPESVLLRVGWVYRLKRFLCGGMGCGVVGWVIDPAIFG